MLTELVNLLIVVLLVVTTHLCTITLLTWRSKKQMVVVWSSAESEYIAMAHNACEMIWIQSLLCEMGIGTLRSRNTFLDMYSDFLIIFFNLVFVFIFVL